MEVNIGQEFEDQANAATKFLSGGIGRLLDDGVECAALVSALASALGAMMAFAPRHMAESLDVSVLAQIQRQRAATWAALDAPAAH